MKDNKGITLVALVITIIVLLILAGVTVASLSGEDGLLTRGSQAVSNSNIADAKEKVTLAFDNAMSGYYEAKYASKDLENQTEDGTKKVTAVAYVAKAMLNNAQFTEVAKIEGKSSASAITGDETELTIVLTNVKEQNANQTDKAEIKTILQASGNACKLLNAAGQKWSDEPAAE